MGEAQSLATLFDYLPDVYFYLKDEKSRFIRVNEPMLRTHGMTHEGEMVGKTDFDFQGLRATGFFSIGEGADNKQGY